MTNRSTNAPTQKHTSAPSEPEWFIVLDIPDDLSWNRDELYFAPSSSCAEAMYRAAAADEGHVPATLVVHRTNVYFYIPPGQMGYFAQATSSEFETGAIQIDIMHGQHVVKEVNTVGRAGLVELLPPAIHEEHMDPHCGMAGLLRAAMSHILMREADSRGAIRLH